MLSHWVQEPHVLRTSSKASLKASALAASDDTWSKNLLHVHVGPL